MTEFTSTDDGTDPAAAGTTDAGPRRRRLRRIAAGAAAALAATTVAGAVAVGAAVPASAATNQMTNVYLSPESSAFLMLDVSGASQSSGAQVIQWYLNGGANQRWDFAQTADGYKQIINVNSGQCLTTDGRAGDGVYQSPCVTGALNQEWSTDLVPNGSDYTIESVYSGLYLDVYGDSGNAGANLDTWYWNGGWNQHFAGFQG